MHFEDLTSYAYFTQNRLSRAYNIGWVEADSQLKTGIIDSQVPLLLERYYADLVGNQTRGYHGCALCGNWEPGFERQDQRIILGAAELWIPSDNDRIFVAPDLVIHYLREHSYRPPDEFITAVLRLPSTIIGWSGEAVAASLCRG